MSMTSLKVKINGIQPLLLNNPQTVDRFNKFSIEMKKINDKRTKRTDEDYMDLRVLERRSKIYWDDEIGIYVPSSWITASLEAFANKVIKSSKAEIRGTTFITEPKLKLAYEDSNLVKTKEDVIRNDKFEYLRNTKQGQIRVIKAFPIFHNWSFSFTLEFDDNIIDVKNMARLLEHCGKYGGFGDFRPSFGRALVEAA